jgi:predicted amidohydrolase
MTKVTLAAACMRVAHDKTKNLETYAGFVEEAGAKGAALLAFPECSLQGYTWAWDPVKYEYVKDDEQRKYFAESAEAVPGKSTESMARLAKKHGMYIQFGMAEREGDSIFNSAVLVGPGGLVGVYRKVHMAPNPIFERGKGFVVFETAVGKVAPVVCADLQFPETVRTLAVSGAEVVVNSTAWGMRGTDPETDYSGYMYDMLTRANSLMNQVWMVSANQVGPSTRSLEHCYGHSRILNPMGQVVSDTGYREGLASATVDIRGGLRESESPPFVGKRLLDWRRPSAYEVRTKTEAETG